MTDPTKYVRKMYYDSLIDVVPVYDGMPPADHVTIYAVIISTSWTLEPATKGCTIFRFVVNLELYQEFKEYGSSVGVDDKADQIIAIMCPQSVNSLPSIGGGYHQNEVKLPFIENDSGRNDALAIWRKKIQLVHIIS